MSCLDQMIEFAVLNAFMIFTPFLFYPNGTGGV